MCSGMASVSAFARGVALEARPAQQQRQQRQAAVAVAGEGSSTSRVGKRPIPVPKGVTLKVEGQTVTVKVRGGVWGSAGGRCRAQCACRPAAPWRRTHRRRAVGGGSAGRPALRRSPRALAAPHAHSWPPWCTPLAGPQGPAAAHTEPADQAGAARGRDCGAARRGQPAGQPAARAEPHAHLQHGCRRGHRLHHHPQRARGVLGAGRVLQCWAGAAAVLLGAARGCGCELGAHVHVLARGSKAGAAGAGHAPRACSLHRLPPESRLAHRAAACLYISSPPPFSPHADGGRGVQGGGGRQQADAQPGVQPPD